MQELTFGYLLKKYRKKAGFKTLSSFVNALADEGLIYSESILSRWQKGSRLPRDRKVFITIFKILISKKAINNIYEANLLLSLANMGYLTSNEIKNLLGFNNLKLNMILYKPDSNEKEGKNLSKISLILPENLDKYLCWVSNQYKTSKAEVFRNIIDKNLN